MFSQIWGTDAFKHRAKSWPTNEHGVEERAIVPALSPSSCVTLHNLFRSIKWECWIRWSQSSSNWKKSIERNEAIRQGFRVEGRAPVVTVLFPYLWAPLFYAGHTQKDLMETLAWLWSNQELFAASLEYRFKRCEPDSAGNRQDGILALPMPNLAVHLEANYEKNNL